jgi:hypothetical protein
MEVGHQFQSCCVSERNYRIAKSRDVDHGHFSNELIAQGFNKIVIMIEIMLLVGMSSVLLNDLSGRGIVSVCRNSWRICGRCECDMVDAAESVVGWGGRQCKVAIDAFASVGVDGVGVDGGCVGIELDLHHLQSFEEFQRWGPCFLFPMR